MALVWDDRAKKGRPLTEQAMDSVDRRRGAQRNGRRAKSLFHAREPTRLFLLDSPIEVIFALRALATMS